MTITHVQQYRHRHDNNGNPRRLWVFYDEEGNIARVKEEGYDGPPTALKVGEKIVVLPPVNVLGSEYEETRRFAEAQGIFVDG